MNFQNFTYKQFKGLHADTIAYIMDFMNPPLSFILKISEYTLRLAKEGLNGLRKAIGCGKNRSCIAGRIVPMGVRTVYPLSYDLNASQSDRKDLRFVIAYTNWKCHLLDWKFKALLDRLDEEIEMELTLQQYQSLLIK